MNKKELIEGIQNLEFESEDGAYQRGFDSAKYWCLTLASNLEESKADKVEVPDFVAEWLKSKKYSIDIIDLFLNVEYATDSDGFIAENWRWSAEFYEWVSRDPDTLYILSDAMRYGYTIKPKKWVVKKGRDCVLTNFTFLREDLVNYDSNSYGKDYLYFTDKAKAEAVALLVDGSVEEV